MSVRAARLAGPLLLAACGASGRAAPPSDASPEAAVAVDAGEDAPAGDADLDPNVYPAPHHLPPLARNEGGAVLFSPAIATVTFTGDTNAAAIRQFGAAFLASNYAATVLGPYNVFPPTNLGPFTVTSAFDGGTIDDRSQLAPWIESQVSAGALPNPDANSLFVLYLPPGLDVTDREGVTTCAGSGGYHDVTGGSYLAAYAVVAQCAGNTMDDLTFAASHETIEAITNPQPAGNGGFYIDTNIAWTGAGGGEVADICQGDGPIASGGYAMARIWSNPAVMAGKDPCQPSPAGALYYAAALNTVVLTYQDESGTFFSDGFVTVQHGASATASAMFFSEAMLPSDPSLVVGVETTASATNPTALGPIAPGVTAQLSRASAHNGNAITLSITAEASATPGDYPFVIRAILSATDFHSWPAILRVE